MSNRYTFAQAIAISTLADYVIIVRDNNRIASLPSGCSSDILTLKINDSAMCSVEFKNNTCTITL